MAIEWASPYVFDYQGESEEEEISQKALDEGMWMSDDEEEEGRYLNSVSGRSSKTDSGFWGSLLKRVRSGRKKSKNRRKSKRQPQLPTVPQGDDGAVVNSSDEEEEVKPKKKEPPKGGDGYAELQFPDRPAPTNASMIAAPPSPPSERIKKQRKQRVKYASSSQSGGGIKTRRADTNILAVKFNTLREAGHIHTGDAQFCSNTECGAVVSHLTKLIGDDDDDKKTWNCEFCGTVTELDIVREEIPTEEDTTYLITPAVVMATEGGGTVGMDESLVVFCIDTSGSMCVTTEVPGHYDIRGAKDKEDKLLQSLPTNIAADVRQAEYRMRHMSTHNVTWISRMESLRAAIDTQLSRLVHSEPSKRVSIVTFSDDVTIMGDGRMVPVTIAGEKLSDSKSIIDVGRDVPLPAPIRETQKALSKKIFSLEESGQTALGPAALASVVIASQKPGSRVVLCTDGLANVGLGSLDIAATARAAYAQAENFYEDLGDIAMDKGVTVSLLSIKGSDCRVVELGQVSTRTGGQVTIVDPLTVTEEFGSILSNPILATDVVTKIIVHREMYFRNEDSKENIIMKQVGNVTADTQLTFEYGIRKTAATRPVKKLSAQPKKDDEEEEVKSKSQASGGASINSSAVPPQMVNGQPHLPFQLQIEYTNSDGDRCLRVITQTKPVTKDRLVAEKAMDVAVISSHVGKKAAELTMQGEFTQARVSSLATQKMLQEHSRSSTTRRRDYTTYCENLMPLENQLHCLQMTETSQGLDYSDEEGEYLRGSDLMSTSYARPKMTSSSFGPLPMNTSSQSRTSKESSRRQEISDDLAFDVCKLMSNSSTSYR